MGESGLLHKRIISQQEFNFIFEACGIQAFNQ